MKLSRLTIFLLFVLVNLGFVGCSSEKILIRNNATESILVNVLSLKADEATLDPGSYKPADVTAWYENQTDDEIFKILGNLKNNKRYAGIRLEQDEEKKWDPTKDDSEFKHSKDRILLVLVAPPKGCEATVGIALTDRESAELSFDATNGLIENSDNSGSGNILKDGAKWLGKALKK
jgi:hypothetical protein